MGGTGSELSQETPGNTPIDAAAGAKLGALFQAGGYTNADLARVIEAWPTLPQDVRFEIVKVVREAVEAFGLERPENKEVRR